MQQHENRCPVLILPLSLNRDSLDDGRFPVDLALKFETTIFIDSSNENVSQERG